MMVCINWGWIAFGALFELIVCFILFGAVAFAWGREAERECPEKKP